MSDRHTITTAVAVHGKPYVPTLLHPDRAETPNMLPISVIAEQMNRHGLPVDVDIICEGRRTASDNYGQLYETFLRGLPCSGQRTVTLLVRLDTRSLTVIPGLSWRCDTVNAAITAAKRIARELNQADCRAQLLDADQMQETLTASIGTEQTSYRDQWTRLRRAGKAYVTNYYLADVRAETINNVWSYPAEHTTLTVRLRNTGDGVRASATVRYTTAQPIPCLPSLALRPFTGRQWTALTDRLDSPSVPVTAELDTAVVAGPSGVLLGKRGDTLLLMPLSDPAGQTRVSLHADERTVRQLIRRAGASGEHLAVNGNGQRTTLAVNNGAAGDIHIEQDGDRITVSTDRFETVLAPVEFRNEETFLR